MPGRKKLGARPFGERLARRMERDGWRKRRRIQDTNMENLRGTRESCFVNGWENGLLPCRSRSRRGADRKSGGQGKSARIRRPRDRLALKHRPAVNDGATPPQAW